MQSYLRRIIGWEIIEQQLDTVRYLQNKTIDITKFPKATGSLRQVQLADTELLRIVCQILEKNNITYWIDYGTLLGAIRHKGFIPWDDDLDICVLREQYSMAREILYKELTAYKIFDIYINEPNDKRIGICIWKAGCILDVFPMDNVDSSTVTDKAELKKRSRKYEIWYKSKCDSKSIEELRKMKYEMIGKPNIENPYWYHNPEFACDQTVFENSIIFPLKKVFFEGYEFYAPNDVDAYLKEEYDDYMSLPKNKCESHTTGGLKISDFSAHYRTDMKKLIVELKNINPLCDK